MKTFICFLFPLLLVSSSPQKGFLDIGRKKFSAPVFSQTYHELFSDSLLGFTTAITLDAAELAQDSTYDFSKLESLETVVIQYTINPDSSDEMKQAFIARTNGYFSHLHAFAKCPKLKTVIFKIGEQIYLTEKEKQKILQEENDYEKQYKKMAKLNTEKAWAAFGSSAQEQLPGVELYAVTWGW